MAYAILRNVRYAGLASCVPGDSVSNLDCPPEQRAERERLVRNIGIDHRRVCAPGVCFSDLAQRSAETLLDKLGWDRAEVDAVVVVTQSSDYAYPGTAVLMQDRLGLPQSCLAFDINLGCSGYPYGLFAVGTRVRMRAQTSMTASDTLVQLLNEAKRTWPRARDGGGPGSGASAAADHAAACGKR